MHRIEPQVFLIAATTIDHDQLDDYLKYINATDWSSDANNDVEEIIEIMGRSCYKSFGTELNPNVTMVRKSNEDHLTNLIKVGHGSVMEHAWVSFMFCDVSRVLTHELVRHRAGTAVSQESLRFVRLTDIGLWIPSCFANDPQSVEILEKHWEDAEKTYSLLIKRAGEIEGVDFDSLPFSKKKEYTSAARRVSPIGTATNIGWSCNMRSMRHVIEMRTSPGAEEEIRLVFLKVAEIAKREWPNLFSDYEETTEGYTTDYKKV